MPLDDITNAEFDAVAVLVPGPFGPLTRVTDLNTNIVSPNSMMPVRVTSLLTVPFDISFDQMSDVETRDKMLFEAHGALSVYWAMANAIRVLHAHLIADIATVDDAEIYALLANMRNLDSLYAMVPHETHYEYDHTLAIVADFTATPAAGGVVNFDSTITGAVDWWVWLFNDAGNNISILADPTFDYNDAVAHTATLIVMGKGSRYPVVVTKGFTTLA